jgi:hypothetical protein
LNARGRERDLQITDLLSVVDGVGRQFGNESWKLEALGGKNVKTARRDRAIAGFFRWDEFRRGYLVPTISRDNWI